MPVTWIIAAHFGDSMLKLSQVHLHKLQPVCKGILFGLEYIFVFNYCHHQSIFRLRVCSLDK